MVNLQEEKELVHRAQKDPQVFGEIFDKYYPQILNYIIRRTSDVATAQDIASETFLKALLKLHQFKWQNVPFSAWLYRIATNEINTYFRKSKHKLVSLDQMQEESGFEPSHHDTPHSELMAAQDKIHHHKEFLEIKELILTLPLKYQEVLALRFFQKKKILEIAKILGKKEGTIKALLSRGLAKLEKLALESRQPEEKTNFATS